MPIYLHMVDYTAEGLAGLRKDGGTGRVAALHTLAESVDADSIYAVPTEIADKGATVAKLCRALADCTERERQTLLERFNQQRAFVYVRRQVSPE